MGCLFFVQIARPWKPDREGNICNAVVVHAGERDSEAYSSIIFFARMVLLVPSFSEIIKRWILELICIRVFLHKKDSYRGPQKCLNILLVISDQNIKLLEFFALSQRQIYNTV
jgi:hypothetical protein